MRTRIIGTGSCMPEMVVTNDDLSKIMDTSGNNFYFFPIQIEIILNLKSAAHKYSPSFSFIYCRSILCIPLYVYKKGRADPYLFLWQGGGAAAPPPIVFYFSVHVQRFSLYL